MNIKAEKINPIAFDDVVEMLEKYTWLKLSQPELLELWNFCDSRQQQLLIKELISKFIFIDTGNLEKIAKSIVAKIDSLHFKPLDTFISATSDTNEIDGSHGGLQFMKNKFSVHDDWKDRNFLPNIIEASHELNNNQNLLLFDDFIGSGKTIIRKLTYLRKIHADRGIKTKKLVVIAFAGMKFGIKNIISKFDIEVYAPILLDKGISECNGPADSKQKIDLMLSLENKLGDKFKKLSLKDHSLGYKGSETLFQVHGQNCPNNLFPIFWWPILKNTKPRLTIFNRSR